MNYTCDVLHVLYVFVYELVLMNVISPPLSPPLPPSLSPPLPLPPLSHYNTGTLMLLSLGLMVFPSLCIFLSFPRTGALTGGLRN